jgi:hypothetical protein
MTNSEPEVPNLDRSPDFEIDTEESLVPGAPGVPGVPGVPGAPGAPSG